MHLAPTVVSILSLLAIAGGASAGHDETKAFEERNRGLRKAAEGKVRYEKLQPHWGKSSVSYKRADGEGWWQVDLASGEKEKVDQKPDGAKDGSRDSKEQGERRGRGPSERGATSPDKKWKVELKDHEVVLHDPATEGRETLTTLEPGKWRFDRNVMWSPNSKHFVVWKRPDVKQRIVTYVESSPEDRVQPKTSTNGYPKPGDELSVERPVVFTVGEGNPIEVDEALAPNAFDFRRPAWRKDGARFVFEYIERGFGKHRVLEIDAAKRSQRIVVNEESDTFVFVFGKSYRHDLDDGKEILWLSERDGWNHLYLMDGATGKVKRQLTKGNWVVREVVRVDAGKREALLKISGYYGGQDPYFIHWARVGIDDGKLTLLTEANGTHELQFSPDRKFYVASWSRVDHPPVHELRRSKDGSLVTVLEKAKADDLVATGWQMPQPFVAKDRDGQFDIWGVIWKPRDFDPGKKYAVVEKIYAGPQDSYVPKSWRRWSGSASEMAAAGFIVVQIDGRGTSNRCREFHHFCYKNLMDAGLPDRIAWMQAAAKEAPQMDLERVGIFGGSAGGQSALGALLFHPDFYDAAAADCGCHDNRMDKIWWNEQWMDWPIDEHYAANSNVTHAAKLQGDLLLTVGELDKNVDPASTMQVVNALIKADKDFELCIVPGAGHGVGERPYLKRRRVEFFQRSLGGPKELTSGSPQ